MTLTPLAHARVDTPFGDLHVLATPEDGVVRAAGFRPMREVVAGLPTALSARGWEDGPMPGVVAAIEQWLAGEPDAIAHVPVEQSGGPFFQEVWQALRDVPAGEVVSYQELAGMAGRPRAMRAVGTACARNDIALFVPCHRVIQAGGRLGSYGLGGLAVKAAMLEHEGFTVTAATADARVTVAR